MAPRAEPLPDQEPPGRVLRPGETCWRIEKAGRFATIVDAADYFAAARQALMKAEHQVMLIAWDFDTRIKLDPDAPRRGPPRQLGRFLAWLVRAKPHLRIHVLKWRYAMFNATFRGMAPLFVLDWLAGDRLQYRLASDHPVGACHHQKILVIDDTLAFCGGIDMTSDRWDTSEHLDYDHHRRRPSGLRYQPFHDVTTAVDGDAARALGQLARERWRHATGEDLPVPTPGKDAWPDRLRPLMTDVPVGIARTQPAFGEQEQAHEIEALWLAAIRAARHRIYLESQYFASRLIAKAILERLQDPDGPEVVVINPTEANGWLEEQAMGTARDHLVAALRAAAPPGRFGIYAPLTARGRKIYVHAKVLVVDDRLLRVGSSNVNNRSMGLDTECDIAVEASNGEEAHAIASFRLRLLAEHLGSSVNEIRAAEAEHGSMLAMVEALRRRPGRTLMPLRAEEPGPAGAFMVENELLDPERPRWPLQSLIHQVDWNWAHRKRRR